MGGAEGAEPGTAIIGRQSGKAATQQREVKYLTTNGSHETFVVMPHLMWISDG